MLPVLASISAAGKVRCLHLGHAPDAEFEAVLARDCRLDARVAANWTFGFCRSDADRLFMLHVTVSSVQDNELVNMQSNLQSYACTSELLQLASCSSTPHGVHLLQPR